MSKDKTKAAVQHNRDGVLPMTERQRQYIEDIEAGRFAVELDLQLAQHEIAGLRAPHTKITDELEAVRNTLGKHLFAEERLEATRRDLARAVAALQTIKATLPDFETDALPAGGSARHASF